MCCLPPTCYDTKTGNITLRAYWQPVFPRNGEHIQIDPNEAAEEFISRLRQTLNAWRMSDVPIGSLLSGGIDSTSVAALLTESCKDPLHTFHIRFTSKSLDESASASEAANLLGCQHHEINFSMSDFELLPQVIRQH